MTMYNSNFDHTKPISDTAFQANLATGVQQTYTVPGANSQKYRAVVGISANSNVFVGINVAATAPGSGLNSSTSSLYFRPLEPFYVKGGDEINLSTPDAAGAYIGISLLLLPS